MKFSTQDYINRLHEYNINIRVIGEYINCSTPITHECPICKRLDWMAQPQHIWSRRATKCNRCAGRNEWDADKYIKLANSKGIRVIGKYVNTHIAIAHKCPSCGKEDWMVTPSSLISGRSNMCIQCNNKLKIKYTPESYREFIYKKYGVNVIGDYINSYTSIAHECPICKRKDWMVQPKEMVRKRRHIAICNDCNCTLAESTIANIIKQVVRNNFHEYTFEYDAGFITRLGKKSLYDIYIKDINTLIECQSEYHDTFRRQDIDIDKKKFALDNGYSFIEIDSREDSILQAIQKLIPEITDIPEYIYEEIKNKYESIVCAQHMINNGYCINDVAEATGLKVNTIRTYISMGKLSK